MSNFYNARSREARRIRIKRARLLAKTIGVRSGIRRIRAALSRAQESQDQHDERLRQTIARIEGPMNVPSMVEVDPKLFVTCRLCLEDMGVYQIVPSIQQQIKYCFEIDVDPFDGLPQLLCKKCELLLGNYFKTKKSFSDKQKALILKKQDRNTVSLVLPQQDTVSSSQQTNGDNNLELNDGPTKKKRTRLVSNTCGSESDESSTRAEIAKAQSLSVTESNSSKRTSWESDYEKQFICKLCNGSFKRKNAVLSHLRTHKLLTAKHRKILKTYCTVDLTRLDCKPNITGGIKKVVHSNEKITQDGDSYYHIIYVLKKKSNSATVNPSELVGSSTREDITRNSLSGNEGRRDRPRIEKRKSLSVSSGDESPQIQSTKNQQRHKRKRRLLSASSSETVLIQTKSTVAKLDKDEDDLNKLIGGKDHTAQSYLDCIDIEDSSDSSSTKNKSGTKQKTIPRKPMKVKPHECKAIHNIISLCHKKYMKRREASGNDTQNKKSDKDYLKHKVLSIGRKIVTKKGLSCNGLLRYMESKNLELMWIPRAQQNGSKETNYIQVNAKLRNSKENGNDFNMSEWKTVIRSQDNEEQEDTEVIEVASSETVDNTQLPDVKLPCVVEPIKIDCDVESTKIDCDVESIKIDCDVMYSEPNNTESKGKLLNENPVANPKHFPKKGNLSTSKLNLPNIISDDITNTDASIDSYERKCLPIITSTKSLAKIEPVELKHENMIQDTTMPGPRIKVKPVTELLSERILHSMNSQTNQQNSLQCQTPLSQNVNQPLQVVETSSTLDTSAIAQEPSTFRREYVILDTVELPNTKTSSPFMYFKKLLQIHNIVLLDTDQPLPNDFACLIKFKVCYKQETKEHPVILCLSLFCCKNTFCLKVKDRNHENINMTKISANWQWELLKIYKSVPKLLQNASKINQKTHDYTKTFLCLLESINFKIDT